MTPTLRNRVERERLFLCLSYDPADKRGWVCSVGAAMDARVRIPEVVAHGPTPEKACESAEKRLDGNKGEVQ